MVVAASAIIIEDNKIFLIKRSNYTKEFPSCWACPGGRANNRESPEETVKREVKEETNLDFFPSRLFVKNQYKERELYRFLGKFKGTIKIQNEEIDSYNWFSYKQTLDLPLAFDYKEIIDKLHQENIIK